MNTSIIQSDEVIDILWDVFKKRFTNDYSLIIADDAYYCPTLTEVRSLLSKNHLDKKKFTDSKFDCDDYAFGLKNLFIKRAYYRKQRKNPYCVGLLWGNVLSETPHAINFVITNRKKVYLIEPQQDKIIKPTPRDDKISFVYV